MSYCNRLTANLPIIDMDILKQYLAIVNNDDIQDGLINLYLKTAISYIENTYNIALAVSDYACNYSFDYVNLHLNRNINKIELNTIKPLNSVQYVRLLKSKPQLPTFNHDLGNGVEIKPFIEVPFCVENNKTLVNPACLCNFGCNYLQIKCNAGYAEIPSDILMAIYQMVMSMYQKGECDCVNASKDTSINQLLNSYNSYI